MNVRRRLLAETSTRGPGASLGSNARASAWRGAGAEIRNPGTWYPLRVPDGDTNRMPLDAADAPRAQSGSDGQFLDLFG